MPITQKYQDEKYLYVFSKDQVYFALSPEQVFEMHKLTRALLPDAAQKMADRAEEEAKKVEKAAKKTEKGARNE